MKPKRFFAALVALVGVGVCGEGVGQPLEDYDFPSFFHPVQVAAGRAGITLNSPLTTSGYFDYSARVDNWLIFEIAEEREAHVHALRNFQESTEGGWTHGVAAVGVAADGNINRYAVLRKLYKSFSGRSSFAYGNGNDLYTKLPPALKCNVSAVDLLGVVIPVAARARDTRNLSWRLVPVVGSSRDRYRFEAFVRAPALSPITYEAALGQIAAQFPSLSEHQLQAVLRRVEDSNPQVNRALDIRTAPGKIEAMECPPRPLFPFSRHPSRTPQVTPADVRFRSHDLRPALPAVDTVADAAGAVSVRISVPMPEPLEAPAAIEPPAPSLSLVVAQAAPQVRPVSERLKVAVKANAGYAMRSAAGTGVMLGVNYLREGVVAGNPEIAENLSACADEAWSAQQDYFRPRGKNESWWEYQKRLMYSIFVMNAEAVGTSF